MNKLVPLCFSLAAASTFFLTTETAHAGDIAIGAAVGVAVPLQSGFKAGVGFDGDLGYRLHFGPLWLQPELAGGFRNFGSNFTLGHFGAGARFGLGGLIQPSVYAHLGGAFGDTSGFLFDGGGALDLKVSVVYVGVFGGVGILSSSARPGDSSFQFLDLGLHAGVLL